MKPFSLSKILPYLYLALLIVILTNPPITTASPETKTVSCPGGRTVSCTAHRCVCVENSGCTGYDSQGNVTSDSPCPARYEIAGEDGLVS